MARECPICDLVSPSEAQRCDCGYNFHTRRLERADGGPTHVPGAVASVRLDAHPEFTGRGEEYFRIWLVNIFLTLLTLGVYSAWAKVRKAKYFRHNTRLDNHVFDYHGNPVAILRGRLVALILLAAYAWGFQFSNTAGLLTVATLCIVGPVLFMRAQQFSLANTSYRGLRFSFRSRAAQAYGSVLPILALWLSPIVATTVTAVEGSLSWVPIVGLPWMHHRLKAYQRRNVTYGERQFTFTAGVRQFYGIYARGIAFHLIAVGLAGSVILGFFAMRGRLGDIGSLSASETAIVAGVVFVMVYVVSWPYHTARLQQVIWSGTSLGNIGFRTEIQALVLFRLVLSNMIITLVTCGLYWPWAAVNLARYRIQCVRVESDVPLSTLAAGIEVRSVSAAGVGATDLFGFDIGL